VLARATPKRRLVNANAQRSNRNGGPRVSNRARQAPVEAAGGRPWPAAGRRHTTREIAKRGKSPSGRTRETARRARRRSRQKGEPAAHTHQERQQGKVSRVEDGLQMSPEQWRQQLSRKEFKVLRLGETERPGSGRRLLREKRPGTYNCRGCGNQLFHSATKFNSKTGWPSFYAPIDPSQIQLFADHSHGLQRQEVRCARCGGHLGHVFYDAPQTPTGARYCVNAISLGFKPAAT
jgi:peptide-methionine (R)-S-oxide reductase